MEIYRGELAPDLGLGMSEIRLRLMPSIHPNPYLSASRLGTYDRCPELYRQRYVERLPQGPSFERDFGTAVHRGIEASYRGLDYEMAFLLAWRVAQKECRAAGITVPAWLTDRGLELIEAARSLGIPGEPEQRISLFLAGLSVPIIGYVDLVSDGAIYDWKTTAFGWGQERANREVFQPAIYAQAYAESHAGQYPTFTYVVLPRNGGTVQLRDGTRTTHQIFEAFERTREIHQLIEASDYACTCKGKFCQVAAA